MHTTEQLNTALDGRYVIERRIGAGGMAVVYLARDLRHQRLVALKVLNPELGAVLGSERFMSEIQVTANLHHPNLLPLFDSGEAGGLLFYVMPYIEGETLRRDPPTKSTRAFHPTGNGWPTSQMKPGLRRYTCARFLGQVRASLCRLAAEPTRGGRPMVTSSIIARPRTSWRRGLRRKGNWMS